MPFPRPHLRVTFFGDGWNLQEEWSTGLRLDGQTMPTDTQMTALDTAFNTLFSHVAMKHSPNVRYLGVKVAPQDVSGLYGASGIAKEKLRTTPTNGAGSGGYPQISLVATLTTAMPRGLANEGRMYLPASGFTCQADGRISTADQSAALTALVSFINSVDAVGLGQVAVFSTTREGAARDVTGVRVGRVLDTQRRRRNHIAEMYAGAVTGP